MKQVKTWQRITAMLLAILAFTGTIAPVTEVYAESVPSIAPSAPTGNVPNKSISLAAGFAVVKVAGKAVLAANYASQNSDVSVGDWLKMFMVHMNGNAQIYEQTEDLKKSMLEQHKLTQVAIEDLKNDIANLQQSVSDLKTELENTVEYTNLRTALNQFYTEFFASAYDELETAYLNVSDVLEDPLANEAIIRAKIDDLYMKAYKMKNLQGYITGEINFESKSILDLYYDYLLKLHKVQPGDSESYWTIAEKCKEFTLKLYCADAFQKYCLSYASSYQLNFVYDHMEEMAENGEFVGYILDGTLDGFSNKMTLQEIKRNIAKTESGLDVVSARVSANLAKIYLADTYAQYTEGMATYIAPVSGNKISVYKDASYGMTSIPMELQEIFGKDFSFVVSNASAADVTASGNVKVNANAGTKFTVSYVYGNGVLEQPITVYSVDFTVAERKWAGGYGTASAPYLISNIEHMKEFASNSAYWASGVHVKLISDLDASGKSLGKVTEYFGTFDGGNNAIKNISSSGGLFGTNKGVIKNLELDKLTLNYSAAGSVSAGGIVDINSGVIENCHLKNSNVTVYCHNYKNSGSGYTSFTIQAGGIAGSCTSGSAIRYCYVGNTKIQGQASSRELYNAGYVFDDGATSTLKIYIGGVVGLTSESVIENNYAVKTTVSSRIFAQYYKWKLLWEHTYNKVNASIYSGVIAGNQSGSFSGNAYYSSDSSDANIQKIASTGSLMSADDGFVSDSKVNGVQGTKMTQEPVYSYVTSISISKTPIQTLYHIGDTVNTSGLKVVDNFNNPVCGYSVVSEGTESNGKKIVTVEYLGHKATFEVEVGCLHKNIAYAEAELNKETLTFYTAGIFCNDCQTYTNGRESTAHESCVDSENDHVCDVCATTVGNHEAASGTHVCAYCKQTVSECSDADKNHKCDVCGKAVGVHEAMEGGHICAYCDNLVTYCVDNDKNHSCDICGVALGTHKAETGSHYCSYCGKALSACVDIDKDEKCDICEKNVQNPPALTYQMGDVNGDGKINSRDALMIKQYVVKMITFTEEQLIYANVYYDVNSDGTPKINSRDAMLLQQFIVKMDVTLGGR